MGYRVSINEKITRFPGSFAEPRLDDPGPLISTTLKNNSAKVRGERDPNVA